MTDNADLIARLNAQRLDGNPFGTGLGTPKLRYANPDGPEAAAAIASLTARVAETEAAARVALNYISNTESELGITLSSGDALRAALKSAQP